MRNLPLPVPFQILEVVRQRNCALLRPFAEVHAMALDKTARTYARSRTLAGVRPSRLPDVLAEEGKKFDLIVMTEILEHLERLSQRD